MNLCATADVYWFAIDLLLLSAQLWEGPFVDVIVFTNTIPQGESHVRLVS